MVFIYFRLSQRQKTIAKQNHQLNSIKYKKSPPAEAEGP